MVKLSDWQTESVTCPACKATLTLSVDVSIDASLEHKDRTNGAFWNSEDRYDMNIIGQYQRRIPNIGLCGAFFDANYKDNKFLCNGYFALKNIEHLELEEAKGYKKEGISLDPIVEKFSDEIQEVFPGEMTSSLVRVQGGAFDRIFIRRYLDFIYAVFPDARLYSCAGHCRGYEGLIVKSGDDLCGLLMPMQIADPATNPWTEK